MSMPQEAYLEQFHFVSRPIGKSGKTKGAKHMGKAGKSKGGKSQVQVNHHRPQHPQHRPAHSKSSKKFHGWRPTQHTKHQGKSGKGAQHWWRPPPTNIIWWGHAKSGKRMRTRTRTRARIFSEEEEEPTRV